MLRDQIKYEPLLGVAGKLFAPLIIAPKLKRMFDYRHAATRTWCEDG